MYSFTYKISLGMVLIRLFLNEIILILIIKLKLKIIEKKLFAIECGNVVLVVRPNGDTVIVTEATELVLNNAVMEQIVRNSGAYKSFVATKDDVIIGLERDNAKLKNTIEDLRGELRASTTYAKPIAKGYIVNVGNLTQGTLGYLFDINGNFIADCGTGKRAKRVQYLLQKGKVSLDMVIEIFGNTGGKKNKAASKAELEDFDWDDVPVGSVD